MITAFLKVQNSSPTWERLQCSSNGSDSLLIFSCIYSISVTPLSYLSRLGFVSHGAPARGQSSASPSPRLSSTGSEGWAALLSGLLCGAVRLSSHYSHYDYWGCCYHFNQVSQDCTVNQRGVLPPLYPEPNSFLFFSAALSDKKQSYFTLQRLYLSPLLLLLKIPLMLPSIPCTPSSYQS